MPARGRAPTLTLGALGGSGVAWFAAAAIHYVPAQRAAIQHGEVAQFAVGPLLLIGGLGAVIGVILALAVGRRPLPPAIRGTALGCLLGVAAVVLATLVLAAVLGGPSSKGQAPYLETSRVYVVPVAALAGGVLGSIVGCRRVA